MPKLTAAAQKAAASSSAAKARLDGAIAFRRPLATAGSAEAE